jgi:hypothetical protein
MTDTVERHGDAPAPPTAVIEAPAPEPRTLAAARQRLPSWTRRPLIGVGAPLAALAGVALALRLPGQGTWFWTDEGISLGIAGHRLADIPGVLRKDGSPPLYYVVLHFWMRLFGNSEAQSHALSLLCAVLLVPAALWAGWSLFGRKTGWIAASLAATSPFITAYSQETRMYTMVALLGLVVCTAFSLAFVRRRRAYVPVFAGSLVLLLYTHNWGLYLAAASALALIPCLRRRRPDRAFVIDAVVAFGAVTLLYLPWVPTLLEQLHHTAAPWSARPVAREVVSALGSILGDKTERVLVALVFGGGAAALSMVRRPRSREGATLVALLVICAVTLGAAWVGAQAKPAWSVRYVAVLFGPVLVVAAAALARGRGYGVAALVIILLIWTQPFGRLTGLHPAERPDDKSAVKPVVDALSGQLHRGDDVVAVQMEEVPVLHYYLPEGLNLFDVTGRVADPTVADWRDALDRVRRSTVSADLTPQVDRLGAGQRLLLVCSGDTTSPRTIPWFELMDERCDQWTRALQNDERLHEVQVPQLGALAPTMTRAVHLFERSS